jgi:hypothetical protein
MMYDKVIDVILYSCILRGYCQVIDPIDAQETAQSSALKNDTWSRRQRRSNQWPKRGVWSKQNSMLFISIIFIAVMVVGALIFIPLVKSLLSGQTQVSHEPVDITVSTPQPAPFDPSVGAVLPNHRVVAFYAIPGAAPTGPAYQITDGMLKQLQQQGAAYQQIDPAHPVDLGIDLVVSVPDGDPGPLGYYSHHVDSQMIQDYIDFCQKNGILLFLDLNFGQAPVGPEVDAFLPYLEKYSFVHMAIDPEWMFPNRDGVPGVNLSNVSAADLNIVIQKLAPLPMQYHVPRKILIIHQYRGDGDGLKNPHAANVEIVDKRNLLNDPRVDVVLHIDSVGNYPKGRADKIKQYTQWVTDDMQRFHNFKYGGFKIFYNLESKYGLMTPSQVLAMKPAPMIVTYGN